MKRLFLLATLLVGTSSLVVSASAAPAPSKPVSSNPALSTGLGFDVVTRIAATGKSEFPPQSVQAHVLLSGTKARIDTRGTGTRAVLLYSPPFVYRLLPESKAGVKWKLSKVRGSDIGGFDPQELLRNPSQIRSALLSGGAKRVQVTQLNGTPVEVFEVSRPGQRFGKVRAWLRRSDSLPLRMETSSGGLKIAVSWSRYARIANVNPTQFAPPKGFTIREAQNPPLLPIL